MTESVIRVENVSKCYTLGGTAGGAQYHTLREGVMNTLRAPWRRLRRSSNHSPDATAAGNEFWALRDVSFQIGRGEVVGIIGRNGAGKSTLLKILSRITEPTTGRITLKGRVASLLEVGTGFHPELTGRENIYLNGAILGMHRAEIKAKFEEIVAFAEVEKFLDTPVKRYSSGMYVRLAFAVAAHLEPEILVVDEVLAVGDIEFQKKCLGKMDEVAKRQGRTVFFVSHNMAAIHQLCTRAILLRSGQMVEDGPAPYVIDRYLGAGTDAKFVPGKRYEETIWIEDARLLDTDGKTDATFPHNEPVRVVLDCGMARFVAGANVGVVVKDGKDRVVFRSEFDLPILPPETSTFRCEAAIPADLLTPGRYVFIVFVHVPLVRMIYLADDALVMNIFDAGSPFAKYEGKSDLGCVFVDCGWQLHRSEP